MSIKNESSLRVLLFARDNCKLSSDLYRELNSISSIDLTYVKSNYRGEVIPKDIDSWSGDYIFCFRSLFILPINLIKKAKIAAINFHPGPPEYPGSGCINFALYDEADTYGVTAHLMNEKVDNGEILEVRRFQIEENDNLSSLLTKTHNELFSLCKDFIAFITNEDKQKLIEGKLPKEFVKEKWSGDAKKIKDLEKLQSIDINIKKSELDRIIRATYIEEFPPKIKLHGYDFYLKLRK